MYDFVKFYQPVGTRSLQSIKKTYENGEDITLGENSTESPSCSNSARKKNRKKNESMDIPVDGSSTKSSSKNSVSNESIPKNNKKNVKSIIKNTSVEVESLNISSGSTSSKKPKKRNKSVSFMLDDNEEVVVKRIKSDESLSIMEKTDQEKNIKNKNKYQNRKEKKQGQAEKENKGVIDNIQTDNHKTEKKQKLKKPVEKLEKPLINIDLPTVENEVNIEKKKKGKYKKIKTVEQSNTEVNENEQSTSEENNEPQIKKAKKKKRPASANTNNESNYAGVENGPASKSKRKKLKPDIEVGLENLNIGDNAHTLTNLLDNMTVKDKNKNKAKNNKGNNSNTAPVSDEESSVKEKVKWVKRKWNKDNKGIVNEDRLANSVIIENLPFDIMNQYKIILTEHFRKYGTIQQVGIIELYPTEEPKPVFTTTIYFDSEEAANKALEEDNTRMSGNNVRVKRRLPATQTTIVVRSYATLADFALSSCFASAGRIRSIRHLLKGKKALSTAFLEFDGPDAVERALKLAEEMRIEGKKIHVSRFEIRKKPDHTIKTPKM